MSASSSSTLGKFELWKCQERRESGRLRLRPWPSLPSCCDDHDYWDAGERQDRDLDYRAPRAAAGFGEAPLFGRHGHSWSPGEEVLLDNLLLLPPAELEQSPLPPIVLFGLAHEA